ncbi:hypothetical protein PENTCL1PPCAC_8424, partial [Pristionchus entomophagus]
ENPLLFVKNEQVDAHTYIHQIESGTIFYRNGESLWARENGKRIEVKLMGGHHYSIMTAVEDSIYYGSNWKRKIYRAVFIPPDVIETYYLRDLLKDENLHQGGLCSIVSDGNLYIY